MSGRNGDQNLSTSVLFNVRPAVLNLFSQNTFFFFFFKFMVQKEEGETEIEIRIPE